MNKYAENTGNPSKVIRLIDPEEKITEYTQIVECKCGKCGKIYQTKYRAFMKSKWLCDDCSAKESKNERLVAQFLQDNNINFISEFVINSCNDIRPLPFDFCLTDYNILVEVDGEQHFSPVRYGGMPQEQAEKIFEYTKKHDKIKNEYCVKFNVPLLRISYKEINNETYKHKILNFIQTARD
jgi:very-short-patch-repair endonuclease